MIHLQYQLTEEEYFEYSYYTVWAAPDRKKFRISYYLKTLFLYGVVAGLSIYASQDHQRLTAFMAFTGITPVYVLLIPFLVKWSVRRGARQNIAQMENKHILDECEVILMDTGIMVKDKKSEGKYSWNAIVKTGETPNGYFLYTNSSHAIVIPKRIMKNTGDENELIRMMNERLSLRAGFPE